VTAFDYILDGLEAALEVERELGVRTVEIDRGLLKGSAVDAAACRVGKEEVSSGLTRQAAASTVSPSPHQSSNLRLQASPSPELKQSNNSSNQIIRPLVFVHDRPLSEKGVEMMAKVLTAMGRTAENTPIVVAPPLPQAKIVVVLGGLALKKHFPEMRGEPGQWQKTSDGRDVLITYSPEYILRFATVAPAVQRIKQDMWRSLKAVVQRLG